MMWAMPSEYVSNFEPSRVEQQEQIKAWSDAEAICRALISHVKDRWDSMRIYELSSLSLHLARTVRAQGRLDEARQLCMEANRLSLVSQDLHL